jgi:hypothetical protein
MKLLNKIWEIITYPYTEYKRKKALKARIEELRKRDPFIYK